MSQESQNKKDELSVHFEEYRFLRSEMIQRLNMQQRMIYYITILLAPIIAAIIVLTSETGFEKTSAVVLLLLPIIFSPLSFLYLMNEVMAMRIGRYIQEVLRPKVSFLVNSDEIWEWDVYHVQESWGAKAAISFGLVSVLARSIQVVPTIIPIVVFFILFFKPPYQKYQLALVALDIILGLAIIFLNVWALFYFLRVPSKYIQVSSRQPIMQSVRKKLISQFEAFRAKKISPLCRGFIQHGQQVLDLGSGSGHVAEQIKKDYGAKLTCLDVVDYNRSNISVILYDGRHIPFKKEKIDAVLLFFVLHHALDPVQLLREAKRVLKTGGNIIILEDIYNNKIEHWITMTLDMIYNHSNSVRTPFNFKTTAEWKQIFKELCLTVRYKKLFSSFCPPSVRNIQFVLTK